jgi:hypothetical protein
MPVQYSKESDGPSTRRARGGGYITHEMAKDLAYYTKTKAELQALLKHMGLPTSGTKDELIERLQDND